MLCLMGSGEADIARASNMEMKSDREQEDGLDRIDGHSPLGFGV
jgi:hypothetical protein